MSKATTVVTPNPPSDAEQAALEKVERDRLAQEEALNDIRAEQQMIEGAVDTDESVRRMERLRNGGQA
jgi:hypothetical protein